MGHLDEALSRLVEQATARGVAAALAEQAARADVDGHGELLVSVNEAARRLDVGKDTVYQLITDGELDTVEGIGRGTKVVVESLRRWVHTRAGSMDL